MSSAALSLSSQTRLMIEILQRKLQNTEACRNLLAHPAEDGDIKEYLCCLEKMDMTDELLEKTSIDATVRHLRQHPVVGQQAQALVRKWKKIRKQQQQQQQQHRRRQRQQQQQQQQHTREETQSDQCRQQQQQQQQHQQQQTPPPECTGQAAKRLEKFRKRVSELAQAKQTRPDMVAYKEFRRRCGEYAPPPRRHGAIDGVPVGMELSGRGEAAILGIHSHILTGIDAVKDKPCYAVCVSGGYADDEDQATDGTVIYTGSGGQKGKRQVKDQEETADNLSLMRSIATKDPIRLLRRAGNRQGEGDRPMYFYEGLYQCTGYTYDHSSDGPMVYKFTLVPIPGHSKQSTHVEHPRRHSTKRRRSSSALKDDNLVGGSDVRDRILSHEHERTNQTEEREMKRHRRDSTRPFIE